MCLSIPSSRVHLYLHFPSSSCLITIATLYLRLNCILPELCAAKDRENCDTCLCMCSSVLLQGVQYQYVRLVGYVLITYSHELGTYLVLSIKQGHIS